MKALILSFFAALLIYTLVFDKKENKDSYSFGIDASWYYTPNSIPDKEQDFKKKQGVIPPRDAALGMEYGVYSAMPDSAFFVSDIMEQGLHTFGL